MTGLELCRALAANGATAHIPVLILTARGYALDQEDLRIGNIKGVLSKPFSPRAVLQLVKETLTAARGSQASAEPDRGTDTDVEAA
jgi:CheY-like chemotaxis protein